MTSNKPAPSWWVFGLLGAIALLGVWDFLAPKQVERSYDQIVAVVPWLWRSNAGVLILVAVGVALAARFLTKKRFAPRS